jgi:class 3 adenylate cyclase
MRTSELVKDEFKSDPVGPIQLKGFAEPVRVCEIECGEAKAS